MKTLLESSALILGLVNGLFLARFYLRDRASLRVRPIHPDTYQWWFRLPDSECDGVTTRRFGFLVYLAAANPGLRATSLDRWRLTLRAANGKKAELKAISMPEPALEIAGNLKIWPVLGTRGPMYDGSTRLEPGAAISGMAFYEYECYGAPEWDPSIESHTIEVRVSAREVFGHRARCRITCHEKSLAEIENLVPGISRITRDAACA